jgi:hypothetical protein
MDCKRPKIKEKIAVQDRLKKAVDFPEKRVRRKHECAVKHGRD